MQDLVGERSSYRLRTLVARGRSGEVHCAEPSNSAEPVAVKIYESVSVAVVEVEALKAIDHPGVTALLDEGTSPTGQPWVALQWVEGRTLAHVLSTEGPLSVERSHRLIEQLASTIDAVHASGYVHGDLSPRNVMVDLQDHVTLVDFGSASAVAEVQPGQDVTMTTDVDTTPRYASPEIARGEPVGPASDRYAVALIAYEALTSTFPFPDVSTPIAMLAHHASTDPDPITEARPSLPASLDAVFAAALAKAPKERPALAMDLAAALVGRTGPSPRSAILSRRKSVLVVAAVAVALAAGAWLSGLFDESERSSALPSSIIALDEPGPAGRAVGVACNLLEAPGFEGTQLPDGFYSQDPASAVAVAPGGGIAASTGLRVGQPNQFGLFGEVVPISQLLDPDGGPEIFVFSAWLRLDGAPDKTGVYVDFLDDQFEQLTFRRDGLADTVVGSAQGSRVMVQSVAPAGAAYAVPTVFKDGSSGSLLVDEAVFASISRCEEPS